MYFELKVFETGRARNLKTKIQFNAGAPFAVGLHPEIGKADFDPKKVIEVFQFIEREVIPRLIIKANEKSHPEFKRLISKKEKMLNQKLLLKNGKSVKGVKNAKALNKVIDDIDIQMLKHARKLLYGNSAQWKKNLSKLTQFNFDELSPARLAQSVQTIVNNNVPPGTRK